MKVMNLQNTVDLMSCILWQYNKAPRIQMLIQKCQDEFDGNVKDFWNNFYTNIFNIDTANTFGLSVWGILLGVDRPTYTSDGQTYPYTDDMYRLLLKSRSLLFRMDGSIYQINRYIEYLFPDRPILVRDGLNMSIDIIFYYTPTADELQVLNNPDFLPRPSGVGVNILVINHTEVFGFDGSGLNTFDNGVFFK